MKKNRIRILLLAAILLLSPVVFLGSGETTAASAAYGDEIGTCCFFWNSICIIGPYTIYNHISIPPDRPCYGIPMEE